VEPFRSALRNVKFSPYLTQKTPVHPTTRTPCLRNAWEFLLLKKPKTSQLKPTFRRSEATKYSLNKSLKTLLAGPFLENLKASLLSIS